VIDHALTVNPTAKPMNFTAPAENALAVPSSTYADDKSTKLDRAMYDDATALMEAHSIIRLAAEPWSAGDTAKAALWRVQRAFPWMKPRRIWALWYHEERVLVTAAEIVNLRAWREENLVRKEQRLRAELEMLAARRSALEATRAQVLAASSGERVGPSGDVVRLSRREVPPAVGAAADAEEPEPPVRYLSRRA
jgi:hypothetical protein